MNEPNSQTLTSVGIDIGTTTTQLVISRLTVENTAGTTFIPRMAISRKEVLHRSRIHLTPLLDHHLINALEISHLVKEEYQLAGISPCDIDTGAVIVTGETAKKENAKAILEALADFAGDFVVSTAGPNLESIYAGKGSGAAAYSVEKHQRVVNIDVGGGTANYAVFEEGEARDTSCINVGGHLIEMTPHGDVVTYIAEPAQSVLKTVGRRIQAGYPIKLEDLKEIASTMAQCVVEVIQTKNLSTLSKDLLMTSPLTLDYSLQKVMVSGGVADHVYKESPPKSIEEVSSFGDFGPLLGWSLREKILAAGFELVKPQETVRATVIGTGTQSINLSGSTIYVQEQTLPMRNIIVASPFSNETNELPDTAEAIAERIKKTILTLDTEKMSQHFALALQGPKTLSFSDIKILAKGIVLGVEEFLIPDKPLILILEKDCGKILGQCITALSKKFKELICIDQLSVRNFEYIDIGKPLMGGRVVPVVIKTLVFDNQSNGVSNHA